MTKDEDRRRFVVDGSRVIDTESEWGGFEVTASGSSDDESRAISVAEALNAADRLEALAQPVVGEDLRAAAQDALKALEVSVQSFPDVERKLRAALAASPSPVVGDREAIAREPVAFLKEWFHPADPGNLRRRVDLSDWCEPWLEDLLPTITPLFQDPHTMDRAGMAQEVEQIAENANCSDG